MLRLRRLVPGRMHPYQLLSLFTTGLVLAICLIGLHALMLAKPAMMQVFLKQFPRNDQLGQILMGRGLAWFWLLGLMVAAPLLGAAFLKDPESRLLVPIYAYGLLTASLFFVGMPYLFRDAV